MNRTRPILSICIPTYNRAEYLDLLLASIPTDTPRTVQVLVADNASTDNTRQVVKHHNLRLRETGPGVEYLGQLRNVGLDGNLRLLAEAASGHYLWFVGSDDILQPGAISRILDTIETHPMAVQLWNRITFDPTKPGSDQLEEFTGWPDRSTSFLDEPGCVADYLERAKSICAAFSFLSSTILPRRAWPLNDEEWEGTYYTQTYAAWSMLLTGSPLVVRALPLVRCKVGNHARRNAESVAHVRLDVLTFRRLAQMQMTEADAQAVRRVLRHEYSEERCEVLANRLGFDPAWPYTRALLMQTISRPL